MAMLTAMDVFPSAQTRLNALVTGQQIQADRLAQQQQAEYNQRLLDRSQLVGHEGMGAIPGDAPASPVFGNSLATPVFGNTASAPVWGDSTPNLPPPATIGQLLADQQATAMQDALWQRQANMFQTHIGRFESQLSQFQNEGDNQSANKMLSAFATTAEREAARTGNPILASYANTFRGMEGITPQRSQKRETEKAPFRITPANIDSMLSWAEPGSLAFESLQAMKKDFAGQPKGQKPVNAVLEMERGADGTFRIKSITEQALPGAPSVKVSVGGDGRRGDRYVPVMNLSTGKPGTARMHKMDESDNDYDPNLIDKKTYDTHMPGATIGFDILRNIEKVKASTPKGLSAARMALIRKAVQTDTWGGFTQAVAGSMLSPQERKLAVDIKNLRETMLGLRKIAGIAGVGKDIREAMLATIPGGLNMDGEYSLLQLTEAGKNVESLLGSVPENLRKYAEKQVHRKEKAPPAGYKVGGVYKEPGTPSMKISGVGREGGEIVQLRLDNGYIKDLRTGEWLK